MTNTTKAKLPDIELASKDWVIKEMIDTERRIEKAFHDQTQYIGTKTDRIEQASREQMQYIGAKTDRIEQASRDQMEILSRKHDESIRWMIGLMITMTIAILVAVLFGG